MENEFIEIRKSSIHNNGVFAKKKIPKGTRIIEYLGERITKEESEKRSDKSFEESKKDNSKGAVYIFELNKKWDIDGDVEWNDAKWINHSCSPNCEAVFGKDDIWIVSLRDIESGEEINYDYGYDLEDFQNHPCKCGSPECIGFIVCEYYREKALKILSKKNLKTF